MKKNIVIIFILLATTGLFAQDYQPDLYEGIPHSNKQRVFLDNFDDNRYFWIKESSPATHRIADGFLYFSNEYDFPYIDGKAIAFDGSKNFELETRIKFVSGDVEAFNGIMWGQLVFGEKYIFGFSSMGYYAVQSEDGFTESNIIEPQQTEIINKTADNNLVVRKYGEKYYFFINQNLIHTMDYAGLPGQYIGFKVAPNSMIRVNFLRLWYIN